MVNCIENNLKCCGCSSCSIICPTRAINISLSKDGFYVANVDKLKCVDCGKCLNVCPKFINKLQQNKFSNIPLYASYSLNKEVQQSCSSGGLAFEIAKYGLENNYKIAGVVYDYKIQKAKTIIVDNLTDLELLKCSKYLQSSCVDSFNEIINSKNKYIVFGTPCQMAGLNLLSKQYDCRDRLILVDFFCHGVPTYLLWDKFLKYIKTNFKIDIINRLNFRDKEYGWHNFTMKVNDILIKENKNLFYQLFFSNLLLNNSCYSCNIKSSFDFVDIRLGDFWGITFDNREDGISTLIPITNNAKYIVEYLKQNNKIFLFEQNKEVCMKTQSAFKQYSINENNRIKLFDLIKQNISLTYIVKKYISLLPLKKKIIFKIKQIIPIKLKSKIRYLYHKVIK